MVYKNLAKPDEKKLAQYKQKLSNHSVGWKTFDTQNKFLNIDLSERKDLVDH